MKFFMGLHKTLQLTSTILSRHVLSYHHRSYCVLNQQYFSMKKALIAKSDKLKPQIYLNTTRLYATTLAERLTIFNPEYDQYLMGLNDELEELNHLTPEQKAQYGKSRASRTEELHRIVNLGNILRERASELKELSSMENDQNDKEIKKMIEDDMIKCRADIEEIQKEVIDLIVGEVETDQNDIILEMSGGVGGSEAMLFTKEIFDMYKKYIQYKGWSHEVLTYDKTDEGGLRKAEIEVCGESVFKYLKYEGGVHRVQRIPQTERSGRIHTSTMTVAVLPIPSEIDVVIEDKDLKIQTFRAQGAGGQHVNKTDSAVRIVHLPTGTAVECQESRSQLQNRVTAMKYLRSRFYQKQLEAQISEVSNARKIQVGTSGRSEKIRTYNFQQDRITDHRINVNFSHIEGFLNDGAELDNLIENLIHHTKYQTLEALIDEYHQNLKKPDKMKK